MILELALAMTIYRPFDDNNSGNRIIANNCSLGVGEYFVTDASRVKVTEWASIRSKEDSAGEYVRVGFGNVGLFSTEYEIEYPLPSGAKIELKGMKRACQ